MPRTTLRFEPDTVNSISTTQSLLLIVLTSCGLLIFLCALPNKANANASSIVDLPAPLCPTTSVVLVDNRSMVVQELPVERKFL